MLTPTEVRTLGGGGDPLVVGVVVPWAKSGYCADQFQVSAVESVSSIVVSEVMNREWSGDRAGPPTIVG
jgi:hypothetical protein